MTKKKFPVVLIIATTCFVLYVACFVTGFVWSSSILDEAKPPKSPGLLFCCFDFRFENTFLESMSMMLLLGTIGSAFALVALVTAWISIYKTENNLLPRLLLLFSIFGAAWAMTNGVIYLVSLISNA